MVRDSTWACQTVPTVPLRGPPTSSNMNRPSITDASSTMSCFMADQGAIADPVSVFCMWF